MTDEVDDGSRVCAVCGRVLAQVKVGMILPASPTVAAQPLPTYRYEHALQDRLAGEDHPPVPVRAGEVREQLQYRCDACDGEPITHTLVVDRELEMPTAGIYYDQEWALCGPCAAFVLADDWLGWRRRVFEVFEQMHGSMLEETKTEMRVMYRDLRRYLLFVYEEPNAGRDHPL